MEDNWSMQFCFAAEEIGMDKKLLALESIMKITGSSVDARKQL